jgi:transposase-like protein
MDEITGIDTPTHEKSGRPTNKKQQKAERRTAGLCPDCGLLPVEGRVHCVPCGTVCRAKAAAYRARKHIARMNAVGAPTCPGCSGRDLVRRGKTRGAQLYHCRTCEKRSFGGVTPELETSCPYCGGICLEGGVRPKRRKRYYCTICGRWNTNLYPADGRLPGGPCRHKMNFYLGPWAVLNLDRYCQKHKMSVAQAVRQIFRDALLVEPARSITIARTVYDPYWDDAQTVIVRAPAAAKQPVSLTAKLPDLREETTRERLKQGRYHRPVAVDLHASIALDDLAKEGLLRTMQRRRLNHQQAARALVAEAKSGM